MKEPGTYHSYNLPIIQLFFLGCAVGREKESAGAIGADMQPDRSGFANKTTDLASGEELEGHERRHECEITAGRETGA